MDLHYDLLTFIPCTKDKLPSVMEEDVFLSEEGINLRYLQYTVLYFNR